MTDSFEKWPAEIQIKQVVSSVLGSDTNLYFVTGLMNEKQLDTLKEKMPVLSYFLVDEDRYVLSTLLTHQQLSEAYNKIKSPAKSWRGQYYVITNRFADACRPYLE